jgi:superfamily II helicase
VQGFNNPNNKYNLIEFFCQLIIIMDMEKICKQCGLEKKLTSFYKNRNNKDGLQSSCKICANHNVKYYRHLRRENEELQDKFDGKTLSMIGAVKSDYCEMYSFLSKIGYNVEEDIHLQFCEKWGITTPKQRKGRGSKKNRYSYKDCQQEKTPTN